MIFSFAVTRSNHSALSISGKSWKCPDLGGYSIRKLLLTKKPVSKRALCLIGESEMKPPVRFIAVSSPNSRRAATSGSSSVNSPLRIDQAPMSLCVQNALLGVRAGLQVPHLLSVKKDARALFSHCVVPPPIPNGSLRTDYSSLLCKDRFFGLISETCFINAGALLCLLERQNRSGAL